MTCELLLLESSLTFPDDDVKTQLVKPFYLIDPKDVDEQGEVRSESNRQHVLPTKNSCCLHIG